MALRLTNNASPAAAPAPTVAADIALLDRARVALTSGDLSGLRALATEATALPDPHRRPVAGRTLVDLTLAHARRADTDQGAVVLAAAECALTVLEPAPAEPVLLNLAGVALGQAGSVKAARALFEAAQQLDPATPSVEGNLKHLRDIRRQGKTLRAEPRFVKQVADLERRAVRVAQAAVRPFAPATIALCMIVRDEEGTVARAITSAKDVVDEIVVVDTGSRDRTPEIARELGATVLTHTWDDDFAAARNAGLAAVTSDWILYLDADEQLVAGDAERLRDLARVPWREGYLLTIVNRVGDRKAGMALTQDVLRMFRNRPQHRFEGRIHESVLQCLPADAPERVAPAGVRIDHDGYLDVTRAAKDKSKRNLGLLQRQLRENPPTAYLHFNVASELVAAGAVTDAATHFEQAWELFLADPATARTTFGPALTVRHTANLRRLGRAADAIDVAARGLKLFPDFTDLVVESALACADLGQVAAAEAQLRLALELGDAPTTYAAVTGAGTFLAATALADVLLKAHDVEQAAAVAGEVVATHPHHDPARLVLADALLALGRYAEAADAADGVPFRSPAADEAAERRLVARAASGDDTTTPLPEDALAPLATVLDGRLAAQDVDGFVTALPLLARVEGLEDRRRRELLARLYLRHGFLDSAADEWAAACDEHGPDAAALTGLSKVAAARGDEDDARVFAEAAAELTTS